MNSQALSYNIVTFSHNIIERALKRLPRITQASLKRRCDFTTVRS
jgi:cell division septal protein FtsQ